MSFYGVSYGPKILAGIGSLGRLGAAVHDLVGPGGPILLVADGGLKAFGIIDRALAVIEGAGLPVSLYAEIGGEPNEAQVEAARELGRVAGARAVVCLGGGSALDAGKLAGGVLVSDQPVAAYRLAATPLPAKSVPIICVPTTAGTGSEMTAVSIVSDEAQVKYWYWGAELAADLAILDPTLTLDLPPRFTAMTGMDALVHAIEAATNRNSSAESDAAAYQAIRLVAAHLRIAVREPQNLEARAGMLDAAALGGLAIARAGTALAHNIGHALGSLAPVPHGMAVTLVMAATAEWVVEGNREAFARVAEAMGAGRSHGAVPDAFRRLALDIGLALDTSAAAPGLSAVTLARRMAAPENAAMRKSTAREVSEEDLLRLARMTLALGSDV